MRVGQGQVTEVMHHHRLNARVVCQQARVYFFCGAAGRENHTRTKEVSAKHSPGLSSQPSPRFTAIAKILVGKKDGFYQQRRRRRLRRRHESGAALGWRPAWTLVRVRRPAWTRVRVWRRLEQVLMPASPLLRKCSR
jgi:hypothetical protein